MPLRAPFKEKAVCNDQAPEPEKEVDIRRVVAQLSDLEYEADKCRQLFRQREQLIRLAEKFAELEAVNQQLLIAATTVSEERETQEEEFSAARFEIHRLKNQVASREAELEQLQGALDTYMNDNSPPPEPT